MIWPRAILLVMDAIQAASFLSQDQKWAILFEYAARFLQLEQKNEKTTTGG
jgi:hypothetical protein